jgi:adenine deaminase
VASKGWIDAIVPLPLSGLMTEASLQDTASGFHALRKAMESIVDWKPPYLVFKACFGATLACNIGPHQTDRGVADVAMKRLLDSPVIYE